MSTWRRFPCIAFGVLLAAAAAAQDFPTRPMRLIVPIGPGGGTDILGRHVAQKLGERLKQGVVVENRPGAGSLVGTEYAARAAPDGYTLLVGGIFNMVMNRALIGRPLQLRAERMLIACSGTCSRTSWCIWPS